MGNGGELARFLPAKNTTRGSGRAAMDDVKRWLGWTAATLAVAAVLGLSAPAGAQDQKVLKAGMGTPARIPDPDFTTAHSPRNYGFLDFGKPFPGDDKFQ